MVFHSLGVSHTDENVSFLTIVQLVSTVKVMSKLSYDGISLRGLI